MNRETQRLHSQKVLSTPEAKVPVKSRDAGPPDTSDSFPKPLPKSFPKKRNRLCTKLWRIATLLAYSRSSQLAHEVLMKLSYWGFLYIKSSYKNTTFHLKTAPRKC